MLIPANSKTNKLTHYPLNHQITQTPNHSFIQSLNHPNTQSPKHPFTHSFNHPFIQSLNHSKPNMNYTQPMLRDGALIGKTIIVTGGGTGLGKSMAKYFLELGANVVICSRRLSVLEAASSIVPSRFQLPHLPKLSTQLHRFYPLF